MSALSLLIVDDSAPMRATIRSLLGDRDYAIIEAADGIAAVEAFERLRPDWVLMDVSMPRMDGIAATRRMLALDAGARVVMVTDYRDRAIERAARDAGAIAYVQKDDLLRLLDILP
jgi:CheY-like chemotaxis protein